MVDRWNVSIVCPLVTILEAIWFAICISLHPLAAANNLIPIRPLGYSTQRAPRYINHRSTVPITGPINSILRPCPTNGQFRRGARGWMEGRTSYPRVVRLAEKFREYAISQIINTSRGARRCLDSTLLRERSFTGEQQRGATTCYADSYWPKWTRLFSCSSSNYAVIRDDIVKFIVSIARETTNSQER